MSAVAALFGVVLLFVLLVVAVGVVTRFARQHRDAFIPLPPEQALQYLTGLFPRVTWAETTGPGQLNRRRRHVSTRLQYTFSLDLTAVEGGTGVSLWMSGWTGNGLIMNNAPSALMQIARLQRRIEAYSGRQEVASDGTAFASDLSPQSAADRPATLSAVPTEFEDLGSKAHLDEMVRRAGYRREDRIPD